jgi:hypothetical protein
MQMHLRLCVTIRYFKSSGLSSRYSVTFHESVRDDNATKSSARLKTIRLTSSSPSTRRSSNNLYRALGQRVEKGLAVLLGQNPVVQHDDDAGVGLGADQPANALAELQDRLRQ